MLIAEDRQILGSVSGGCVESAVIEEALACLASGRPRKLDFTVNEDNGWQVGLSCGGGIEVLIEPQQALLPAIWVELYQGLQSNRELCLLTKLELSAPNRHLLVFADGKVIGDWGEVTGVAVTLAKQLLEGRTSHKIFLGPQTLFAHVFPAMEQLLVIGGGHITSHLLVYAAELEFATVLIEPRQVFAAFPFPAPPWRTIRKWPDEALKSLDLKDSYAVLLSHDPKLDDPALHVLLSSPVAYIGALGSRRTHAKRCARLRAAGFSPEQIARINGPIGLDIGARTPAEIALSAMAQIIEYRRNIRGTS